MQLRFWGVRGSIPSPGPATARYGGNTPCLSLTLDADHTLILDAGTGLHVLGREMNRDHHTWYQLLSHPHWDHIQGLPMFSPLMNATATYRVLSEMSPTLADHLLGQMDDVHFPFTLDDLAADVDSVDTEVRAVMKPFGIQISWLEVNHRGTCFAYRIETPTGGLVYMTDNELDRSSSNSQRALLQFCRGADLLIHDAQFLREDEPQRRGWGHSFVRDVLEMALEAAVDELILFHHDPLRTDDQLDEIEQSVKNHLDQQRSSLSCRAAFEGLTIDI